MSGPSTIPNFHGMTYGDIYAALFQWNLKQWGQDARAASLLTAAGLAGALTMNVALVFGVVALLTGSAPPVPRFAGYLVPLVFLMLNYGAYVRGDRYRGEVRRFSGFGSDRQRGIRRLAWSYVVFSYGAPVLLTLIVVLAART